MPACTAARGAPRPRDRAAEELGYTDDFGNLVDYLGNPVQSDDEYYSDEYSDDE